MGQVETYIVTETPLGWNAPGLFSWDKAQKELLITDRKCTIQVDQDLWTVTELDQVAESLRIFEFGHDSRPTVRVLMPLAHAFAGFVISQEEIFKIKPIGPYWEIASENGVKQLKTIECWKDSELAMGYRHRIELQNPEAKLLAVIVYGVILELFRPSHRYSLHSTGFGT